MASDWSLYDAELPEYLVGRIYDYNWDRVPENELEKAWDAVVSWYERPLNDEWSERLIMLHNLCINPSL